MKLKKEIIIDESTASTLHYEITDLLGFFAESSTEDFIRQEFPHLTKLKRLLEAIVLGEPATQILEKFSAEEKKENVTRLKRRFRLISTNEEEKNT